MSTITDAMVEAATMALLGKAADPLPGIDWWASRQWRVNKVRQKMRKALEAALAATPPAGAQQAVADETPRQAVEAIMAECKFQLTGYGRDIAELAYLRGRALAVPAAAQGTEEMWPTNSYLLNYLCKRIGIELGKDNIATAIKKVSAALSATPAPEAAPSADVAKALGEGKELLSKYEQHAILEDPGAIIRLVNHHDAHEAMAEASDMPDSAAHHMKRAHELLTIGRMVILRDPDLWDAALKAEFAPRAREA